MLLLFYYNKNNNYNIVMIIYQNLLLIILLFIKYYYDYSPNNLVKFKNPRELTVSELNPDTGLKISRKNVFPGVQRSEK